MCYGTRSCRESVAFRAPSGRPKGKQYLQTQKTWAVSTFRNNLKDNCVEKKRKKNRKMEAAAERRQSASTDGCLLSSNYTDEGSFSHLHLRLSADEAVQGGSTLLIDK